MLFLAFMLASTLSLAPVRAETPIESVRPGERPTPGSDEDELWYAMNRVELDLQKSPQLVRDPALNAYVREVACKVAGEYCKDLRVYIVDQPWFNASMAPNGLLVLWTGSLLRMQNEADLALVLGHEFGHYRERHTLQQWRKLKKSSAFINTLGILTSGVGLVAGIASAASMSKFDRDKEREADRIGFAKIVALGYDPQSCVALWDGMLREEKARDYGKPIPVFASHPKTQERRDDLKLAADAIVNPGKALGREPYLAVTSPFLEHWLDNELSRRMYSTSIQVIGDLRRTAPSADAGLYTFYLGEAYLRRNKNDDRGEAAALFAEALGQPGAPPQAWREHGLALRDAGKPAEAASNLKHYLELAPQAEDRAFIQSYLVQLESKP